MKKFLIIFLSIVLVSPVFADTTLKKTGSIPDGVFRKKKNGDFVQIDKNGRKIGIYRIVNGRFIKVK